MAGATRGLRLAALVTAVALAFADASIVVLALPELLRTFDTSVTGVSWVISSYNLVVALAATALVVGARRLSPTLLIRAGLATFVAASIACGVSSGLSLLVAFRCVQGLGAAALLAGSLPLARALARTPQSGERLWALAGAIGTAIGPAAGGALTQAFDWRAIFLAQAPIAALALAASVGRLPGPPSSDAPASGRLRRLAANAALAAVSAALVGALFLVVVLLVDVWKLAPLEAAAVVTAMPAATLAAKAAAGRLGAGPVAAGAVALAGGLVGMALLPASHVAWVVASLMLCGAGLGLTVPWLTNASLAGSARPGGSATWSVAARHAGLLIGLVALTPLLARDLKTGTDRAERAGTAVVLDAPLRLETKLPLAIDLARQIGRTPHGSLPDFRPQFRQAESGSDERPRLERLRHRLDGVIRAVVTRGFRRAFLLAALMGLVALLPLLLLRKEPA